MPDLGENIKEAIVKKLYVKEGDQVNEFQTIADVATDKLFTQIPSSYEGKVHKLYYKEDESCLVNKIKKTNKQIIKREHNLNLSEIQGSGKQGRIMKEDVLNYLKTKENKIQNKQKQTEKYILATPPVRALAKELKVDLNLIENPTGKDGRITEQDIRNYLKPQKQPQQQAQQTQQNQETTTTTQTQKKQQIKMSEFMKGMQKSMTESNKIPHLYYKDEFDLTKLSEIRQQWKKQLNNNVSFMTIFIKSFSLALQDFPILNSHYNTNTPFEYTLNQGHNITIAVDSPNGLVVPNIKNVQNLSVLEVQKELKKLVKLAEQGTLGPKELFDGTICISNIGTIGGTYTAPLILPPQVCIVGLGKVQTLPRYVEGQLLPRQIMNVSFGCDHRIIDGSTVAKFSNQWRDYLENPSLMILNLK
ncbi:hypothetical protein IMG5_003380 [Ichthyophthirius multifiliis]|uniref:Dihydrolipoamide acetyltransferase component of pyruvate dehydrogenase complex n=1 Tax=Ichthyophthirius multifiliis TaxID=5932 RepID=G0QJ96_ICHMU|nr:hypothetical protein IMG5_003380 [Ichthyophthirius multifiliis]EGR34705.1 hypothetical protein IMG5_003380 [Ichthyophthirius multifiliis]|eukprot:XP_004040009.1 hypothetical protein IMG5_003380 [Ichthyophthirius multifiliis]